MKRAIRWLVPLAAFATLVFVVYYNRYGLYDSWRLYNYTPPSTIVSLATSDTMTPYGRHLFYVYHPVLEGAAAFNRDCKVTEQAIVLGCTSIDHGIWLYNVTDSDLNGVEQVTAAHEMLHVAYSRLSASERKSIDALVMSTYNNLASSNPQLKSEEQSYVKTEGAAAVPNEMHSVLGTEVANLPPALENYYKKYFTDREIIVSFADEYEGVFTQRQQTVSADDQQLSSWQAEINSNEASLQTQSQQLTTQQSQLNALKSSGQIAAYNNGVANYNQAVNSYDALVDSTKSLITKYNQLVAQRNSAAISENQLIDSISSSPSTISNK